MKLLSLLIILVTIGCSTTPPLETIKHDDHLFIWMVQHSDAGFIHHPSCPCIKIVKRDSVIVAFPQQMKIIAGYEKQPREYGIVFSEQFYLVPDTTTMIE